MGCNRDKDDGGDGLGEGDGNYEGLDAGDSDYDDTGAWSDWEDDEPIRGLDFRYGHRRALHRK